MSVSEDSDMIRILKKRAAVNRWRGENYDRYILQKRTLAARPEYKAHRREMYKRHTEELKLVRFCRGEGAAFDVYGPRSPSHEMTERERGGASIQAEENISARRRG